MTGTDWFRWIQNSSLRAAADTVLNGGRLSQEDARRTINDLQEESATQIRNKIGDVFYEMHYPTDRHGPPWENSLPVGVVDHYTGGTSGKATLKWFSSRNRGDGIGNSSAHYIIDRDGTILQLINPLERISWHARSCSYTHIGIEHVNAGLLRKVNGSLKYLNIREYPKDRVDRVQDIDGESWEPYTVPQIVANIVLKRWLRTAVQTLEKDRCIDHQMADPMRKLDCGPLWPLQDINSLAFSFKAIRGMTWLGAGYLSQVGTFEFHREVQEYLQQV
ncbi:MAG: hypothetical protein DRJ03_01755 [Chloroflexi bacterium]|nr:MAG: hypothetical protein DRJ03_01755 [Chloroflexota bacterium]